MFITLVGSTGKVGSELYDVLKATHNVRILNRVDCDLTEPERMGRIIRLGKPDVVINATAMNGMEPCDQDPMAALEVNAMAPAIMAAACKDVGARFIHFSTDYVFSGSEYGLFETTPIKPSGKYGWSKHSGEDMVSHVGDRWLVFRLSSIYGRQWSGPVDPVNQVMQGKGTKENPIKVLHQNCAPTSARAVAQAVKHVIEQKPDPIGLYHLATNTGVWKKAFAEHITNKVFGRYFVVEEGTLAVPRPIHTVLKCGKFEQDFSYRMESCVDDFAMMLPSMPKVGILNAAD